VSILKGFQRKFIKDYKGLNSNQKKLYITILRSQGVIYELFRIPRSNNSSNIVILQKVFSCGSVFCSQYLNFFVSNIRL